MSFTVFLGKLSMTVSILQVLEDFDIPEELKDMFISIPAERFRVDLSSTEIRKKSREM